VSPAELSSPAALVKPVGQSTHVLAFTYWFAAHAREVQRVFAPPLVVSPPAAM
tara:strand:+ start:43 stop:201 length:159 start_codon:yes stop_codon:yes gene_type:complete